MLNYHTLPSHEVRRAGAAAVHLLREDAVARFAAEELLRYLPRLLPGREIDVYLGCETPLELAAQVDAPIGPEARSGDSLPLPKPGSILIRGDGRHYQLVGGSPAALLHAAYTLLEALGARWPKPGSQSELIRPLEGPAPWLSLLSTPTFATRGITDGCLSWWPGSASFQDWLAEMMEMVDWMGKMRLNRLFVHFNQLPPGDLSPLLPELERRGIELELGGHSLPRLLPPGARESDPAICREIDGCRRPDGNFCVSSPRTLQLLADGARRLGEQLPPARLYHLWSYDAKSDPWCSCPSCRPLSADEQMWRAVAAAAGGLESVRPGAQLSGLLYHESIGAAALAPEGMGLLYAPRERCYLHPIGDGGCARNRAYARELAEALDRRPGGVSLLEYYGDPILFGRPANRPELVAADLESYRDAGVDSVSTLVFGRLSWWLYPVQLYAFARSCWEPALASDALDDYCRAVAGDGGAELLARYYRLEGEASGSHLRFCGYGQDGSWATLPFPPAHSEGAVVRHLEEVREGEVMLREAGGLLARIAAGLVDGEEAEALRSAHSFEVAFHRSVAAHLAVSAGVDGLGCLDALASAAEAVAAAPARSRGAFGSHWMLPWLRRCGEVGPDAPL